MHILGTSLSTQRTEKIGHFQPQNFATKERRQNILTELVTKFSTSPPLTTPPPEFSPLPANKQKSQIVAT